MRFTVRPSIMPLTATSDVVADRMLGSVIVEPVGTLDRMITAVVTSDPCPTVVWEFNGSSITINNTEFMVSDPCGGENLSPYMFTLTIANLTEETSGEYSAVFTIPNAQPVRLERLFVTIPGV